MSSLAPHRYLITSWKKKPSLILSNAKVETASALAIACVLPLAAALSSWDGTEKASVVQSLARPHSPLL